MSSYAPGHEKSCPNDQNNPHCKGIIHTRAAKQCVTCATYRLPAPADSGDTRAESGNVAEITKFTNEHVRTLADLIRVCEIDTDTWAVDRWLANKWEVGSVDAKKQAQVTPLFQIKVWLKKRVIVIAIREEIASLLAAAKQDARLIVRRPVISRPAGLMLEVQIPDLHVGKLAWSKETGHANYDAKIARNTFNTALNVLLHRTAGYDYEQIVFPIGNDLLNADNMAGTTTAGTQVDTDSRFQRSFHMVREMMTDAINLLASVAPVFVLPVSGNHDTLAVWHLGESLDCYFHGRKDVFVMNAPTLRKYHQFHKVMLMFAHGNQGKRPDYPLIMATEQKEMWGATTHREAHTGHFHTTQTEEYHGVRVRICPALCPPDAWHAGKGFVGNKQSAEAYVWHGQEGLINQAFYTVGEGQ